ncbi:hypothetical protein C1J05_12820 [Sulfitobacter sp. JL08]|nr:hypothetical protein C1J05_12820 [Sulfitobacter sp. JL08]
MPYQLKPESIEQAKADLEKLKPRIMAMPGMIKFINSVNDDGSGCVVSLVESKETSDANAEAVLAMWNEFKDHLKSAPIAKGFEVFADWGN